MNQTSIIHQRRGRRRASRGVDLARPAPRPGSAGSASSDPTDAERRRRRSKRPDTAPALAHPGHPPGRKHEIDPAIPPAGSIRVRAHSRLHPAAWEQ